MAELLLDTTYLLPAFGVALKLEAFNERFPTILEAYSVLYNPISLVEAKWVVLRLSRRRAADRARLLEKYRLGLRVLLADERLKQTNLTSETVEQVADGLLVDKKSADYFDRMIYATACAGDVLLLTEDDELLGLKSDKAVSRPRDILSWKDLLKHGEG